MRLYSLFLVFAPQRLVQAVADQIRHGKKFSVTIELDDFARGIKHHFAVRALTEVLFQHAPEILSKLPVQVFRNLLEGFFAGQKFTLV